MELSGLDFDDVFEAWSLDNWVYSHRWLLVVVAILSILGITTGLIWWFKKRSYAKNPYIQALKKLTLIQRQIALSKTEEPSERIFYSGITEVTQQLLCHFLGNHAKGMTDTELIHGLDRTAIDEQIRSNLKRCLESGKEIKFARTRQDLANNVTEFTTLKKNFQQAAMRYKRDN
ncbi:TPA: hypothetical protein DDZ86_04865 [Candidatus Dependentiae bacterium]|nr:MAG: hypothetical protein A2Y17_09670 [Clostridiales bacterium GWF2_38_85]HBL98944.1 hypothetical protein [Candidatus Dependentiae bacterium]